ncbi:alpha-L-fucosidase [Polaribacter staleyi]|uniref:alpha-L-fucosidase n=1 Tax=Polaribacter staleyi TaxID=2022337 RepID=UPI0031BAEB22
MIILRSKVGRVLNQLIIAFLFCNNLQAQKNINEEKTVYFEPTWESLSQYESPEWFRDAKFGIWAHWGAQCEPEADDWYARNMYIEKTAGYRFSDSTGSVGTETNRQYRYHLDHYGHPSEFGFKDVINEWKAEKFNADSLLTLYKDCGARYFMAMANHHDNFDNYNSKYQPWNSVNMGPKKDLIGEWSKAARKLDLRFGVSVHSAHAWAWYETAQGADTEGPYKGIPYDGKLTKADGKGKWWEGYDPQDLYAQNHKPNPSNIVEWSWDPNLGVATPDSAYIAKYINRVKQLWDDYKPDQIYFDDFILPFYEIDQTIGLELASHFYNTNTHWNGKNEAVMNTKMLNEEQRDAIMLDIEKSNAPDILPDAWQTDECIGTWHYNRQMYYHHRYKQASEIIPMLADIVSKNGNLMLNLPLRGDGTLDSDELKIIKEIGAWLKINGEAIYATRPWKISGEGPSTKKAPRHQTFGSSKTEYSSQDMRFTRSKNNKTLYAIVFVWPEDKKVTIKSLGIKASTAEMITAVSLIGYKGKVEWKIDNEGLQVELPEQAPSDHGFALKISKK